MTSRHVLLFRSLATLLFCIHSIGITDGKASWAKTYPRYCAGKRQSPINLVEDKAVYRCCLRNSPFKFSAHYSDIPESMALINDGRQVNVVMNDNERRELSGGGLRGVYIFHSAHFHYGPNISYGAEHLHDGHRYSCEVHLVHYHSDFPRYEVARRSQRRDAIAVLATWIEPTMSWQKDDDYPDIFKNIKDPAELAVGKTVGIKPFDIMRLMPPGEKHDDYFRYYGSLTTPPCSEFVVWTVFRHPLHVPRYRVEKMFNLMVNLSLLTPQDKDFLFRQVQPLNGRTVYRSRKPRQRGGLLNKIRSIINKLVNLTF